MTLPKFSDKNFSSMFKNRLKSAIFFPTIGLIIMLIFAVITPFSEVVRLNDPTRYGYDSAFLQLENVKYVIFGFIQPDVDFPDTAITMYVTVIIAAILCAIMVFKDLSNKKTANVYYSLGFSRTKLFASTYLAGAVAVLAMTIIPFFLSFIINAFSFGISKELLSAIIFTVSVLCNISLIAYTLAAIAMILSGMFVEGAFFAFFLNSISAMFAFSTCMFSDGLLTGGGFVEGGEYYYSSFPDSFISAFLGQTSFLNSLAHSVYEVNRLGSCLYTPVTFELSEYLSVETWKTPEFIPLLVWSVILVGLVFLAVYAFNKKKPENIGFFASNKILYRLFFLTMAVAFSSLGCSQGRRLAKGLTWLYVLIILAVVLVVITIINLILSKLSKIKFKQEIKFFAVYSGAVILVAAVFSSGFFGYVNRIPEIENVEYVTITAFDEYSLGLYSNDIYDENMNMNTIPINLGVFATNSFYSISKESEISGIRDLHKDLIKADNAKISQDYSETKTGSVIRIEYILKNGKNLSRAYYNVTPEIIDKYLSCAGIEKNIKTNMIESFEAVINSSNGNEDYKSDLQYGDYITVFSSDLASAQKVELTQEQRSALFEAYKKDISNLSLKQILTPEAKSIGVITIREDYDIIGLYDEITGEPITQGRVSELEYSSLTTDNLTLYRGNGFLAITEDMINTIQWAKQADIYKHFAIDHSVNIKNIDATYNNSSFLKLKISSARNFNLLFSARSYRNGDTYAYDYISSDSNPPLAGSHVVYNLTEKDIRYIRENAYPYYLTTQTGYFIEISTDEENPMHAKLFIPDDKLTPELKVKFAQ